MNAFSDQLSAARKYQFDAQLDFARAVTAQAFATAQQVMALNISTSRAQVERSTATFRQLLTISDPRDLFALGSNTQEQLSSMLTYGRELFNIVADARVNLSRGAADKPTPEAEPQAAAAPAATDEPKKKAPRQPAVAVDTESAPELPVQAKPIAKAVRKVAGKRAAPKPAASQLAIDAALDAKLPEGAPIVQLKRAAPSKAQRKKTS